MPILFRLSLLAPFLVLVLGISSALRAQTPPGAEAALQVQKLLPLYDHLRQDNPWDAPFLFEKPLSTPADIGLTPPEGVHGVFLNGPPYQGRETRIFAWYGVPAHEPGRKVPGMVLIHGGGGTAFADWVALWNRRGYAAIAMDTSGCVPKILLPGVADDRTRHAWAGPVGWGGFLQTDSPPADQWPYHAVAAVLISHSFLRTLPDVDPERVGVTGISWGGYLTCIAAGVDPRFKFAMPVYGTGFMVYTAASWLKAGNADQTATWISQWDAANFLGRARIPMLWVDGSSDFFFPLPGLQRSYRLPPGERHLATRVNMKHSEFDGRAPQELQAFADSQVNGGPPLPRIARQGADGNRAWIEVAPDTAIAGIQFNSTTGTGPYQSRIWTVVDLPVPQGARRIETEIPENTTLYYFNVTDTRGLLVSSEHAEIPPQPLP